MQFSLLSRQAIFILILLMPAIISLSAEGESDLFKDLMIVEAWNKRIGDRFPVFYDHSLQGGYINMPSARMGGSGEVGVGYAYVPPYIQYNLRCQLFTHLEVTGNYRVFKGIDDPILSPLGFGDLSDKGANVKFALLLPEDTDYRLPGIAVGYADFMGTQNFKAKYVVLTQVFKDYNLELTLGYGKHRIKGCYGGLLWMPFRQIPCQYFKDICLAVEYDATPYKDEHIEHHPKGRIKRSPWNVGLKTRLWDHWDLSLSYIRGDAWAFSASCYYNVGNFRGFLPKIDDALPYSAPVDIEPLGCMWPEDLLAQELALAFTQQGYDVLNIGIDYAEEGLKCLRLHLENTFYRDEQAVREQLNALVVSLVPEDIEKAIVTIESEGMPIQEYVYRMPFVGMYRDAEIGVYELNLITKCQEASYPDACSWQRIFGQRREIWNIEVYPKTLSFFGSSRGKFKYALGIHVGLNGYLFNDIYYSVLLGKIFWSNMYHLSGIDRLNPSQLINVRTDIVEYYKQRGVTLDEAYVQKNWNMGKGWFSKLSLGLFEEEYGGLAGEILYYPAGSHVAIGIDGGLFKKRTYKGLGFTDKARKLRGFIPRWVEFYGKQFFIDLYANFPAYEMDLKLKVGKFLANDYGARFEVSRYFPSGLEITVWYTYTNAHDHINGKTYHDKGIAFSMPLDIFYTYSERSRFGYGMSAWLRDVGVTAYTGQGLYEIVHDHRK